MDTRKLLDDFATLLTPRTASPSSSTVEAFLSLLEPDIAEAVRRSAIPHEITPSVLQVLLPSLAPERIRALCGRIATYSFAIPDGDGGFSFHDQTRQELFEWWLLHADPILFADLSNALVTEYSRALDNLAEAESELYEMLLRKRMYHLVGANQTKGFSEFERLLGRARYQRRFSECAALVKLMQDYNAVLNKTHLAWLTYHEGKLAADRNQVEIAEQLFHKLLNMAEAPPASKAAALMRVGNLKHRASQMDTARELYLAALNLAESNQTGGRIIARIKHDLGVVYRDRHDCQCAQAMFEQGLSLAKAESDIHIEATILNSLGRLHMDSRRFDEAINSFSQALAIIDSQGQPFEIATLCSNLASAYLERGHYDKSYELYERSRSLSIAAGNHLGQAEALNNLARVLRAQHKLDDAISMLTMASTIFASQGDRFRAGVALHNEARCYRSLNQLDSAEKSLQAAGTHFRAENAVNKLAEIEAELQGLRTEEGWPWIGLILGLVFLAAVILVILTMAKNL